MVHDKPWFDRLLDQTGEFFQGGIVGGSAYYMLKGMYNSPKGECLSRGLQAVRVNAPRSGGYCAIWGGLNSVFESSLIHVRQKDDPWTSILSDAATAGLLMMPRGLGPASSSALIVGSIMALFEGFFIVSNRVQSRQQKSLTLEAEERNKDIRV